MLLVLDASTGQNAIEQARQFTAVTEVTSLALTKLDGTAKGGVAIGISDQFRIPVRFIGLGERMEDLQIFDKNEFVNSSVSYTHLDVYKRQIIYHGKESCCNPAYHQW